MLGGLGVVRRLELDVWAVGLGAFKGLGEGTGVFELR